MTKFLVSGLINVETSLRIAGFPLQYEPVCQSPFGIESAVSGAGYNVARALTALGNPVLFLSIVGHDFAGQQVLESLRHNHIRADFVIAQASRTVQAIILHDEDGRRQVHIDLKDVPDQVYPAQRINHALDRSDQVVLCNVNFNRPLLRLAKEAGKRIFTDVHALASLEDEHNREFLQTADVVFMDDRKLPGPAEVFGGEVMRCYGPEVLVIRMGEKGALLFTGADEDPVTVPGVQTRPVVNRTGAGEAMLSAFAHCYAAGMTALEALRRAAVFASYKIGSAGTAEGFLDPHGLEALYKEVWQRPEGARVHPNYSPGFESN